MTKAVFLDRDGVINKKAPEGDYVTCWEDFKFLPDAVEAVARLNAAGFYVIVVTNQRCIARGLLTVPQLEIIHQRMLESLAANGARVDAIYYCPHEMEPICRCRKPAPGMILDAARDHGIELAASWMIGDSDIDIEAGKGAGCRTARLLDGSGGQGALSRRFRNNAELVADSLSDAARQILNREKHPGARNSSFRQARRIL